MLPLLLMGRYVFRLSRCAYANSQCPNAYTRLESSVQSSTGGVPVLKQLIPKSLLYAEMYTGTTYYMVGYTVYALTRQMLSTNKGLRIVSLPNSSWVEGSKKMKEDILVQETISLDVRS